MSHFTSSSGSDGTEGAGDRTSRWRLFRARGRRSTPHSAAPAARKCWSCGAQNDVDARYCDICGTSISA